MLQALDSEISEYVEIWLCSWDVKARSVIRILEAKPLENWGHRRIILRLIQGK
jgi:hypothetical protein